jgi:hypothetical protein
VRRLSAPTVLLDLVGGRPANASASTGVLLREESTEGGARSAAGERLVATFTAAGELATAQITGKRRMRDGAWTVEGDLVELLEDAGATAKVSGQAGARAR